MDFLPDGIAFNKNLTYLAKTNFRANEQVFGIKRKDRRQHMYLLGKSGSGKSALLANMIVQNVWNGEGVCVVDPHGELVESILATIPAHRAKDVIYFNPADADYHVGFNVLQLDDPRYKHLVASGLMGIFTKIWANAWSARMEYILNNAILALVDTPGSTLLGIPRLLVDKDYRQVVINNLKDPVIKAFWVHEYENWRDQYRNEAIAPIQNKVGQFLSTSIVRNVVGQSKSTLDLFSLMNTGKIFLVNVSKGRIGEDNSALLGGMIITKLQLAAMERVRIPEDDRKDFYLYVDEFQNFVTDAFASILSEARKYRLNLTLAHQYIAQLVTKDSEAVRDAVFGNVGTIIIFRIGAADAEYLEQEFEPEFTPQDMVNLPNYTIYLKLMVDGVTSRPFSAKTLTPFKIPVESTVAQEIIEMSRKLYARPKEIVEKEINDWSGMLVGLEETGKFKAVCSSCGKETTVPFEPEEGRPVYCKDCIAKIKSGEMKPVKGTSRARALEPQSYSALAGLGIEYLPEGDSDAAKLSPTRSPAVLKKPVPPAFVSRPQMSRPVTVPPPVTTPRPSPTVSIPSVPPQQVRPVASVAKPMATHTQQAPVSPVPAPSSTPVSEPRPKNIRPAKERATPDHEGLQSILKSALGDALSKNMQSANIKDEKNSNVTKPENGNPEPEKQTISLSSLKKPEAESSVVPTQKVFASKQASEERMSALASAIAKATNSAPKVGDVQKVEEKKIPEPVKIEPTPVPPIQEEKKPEQEKPVGEKKIREIPEEVLRNVLSE
ncbi:MAG: type IV secretion system DNA-binding domain-containing protein [Candidatus Pacebacteria bacterium]|nr:type IV secretion system DNA-binding domain-containing protein [Candidatus Paceibacterota bacterium]